jgi:hypothetical protein
MDIVTARRSSSTCSRCRRRFTRKFNMERHQRDSCPGLPGHTSSSRQTTWGSLDAEDESSATSLISAAENPIDTAPLADAAVSDDDDDDDVSSQDDEAS